MRRAKWNRAGFALRSVSVVVLVLSVVSACGTSYRGTYSVTDVETAFRKAHWPLEQWPCFSESPFQVGAKACFARVGSPQLDADVGVSLRHTDNDARMAIESYGNGRAVRGAHALFDRTGNVIVSATRIEHRYVRQLETALALLREIRTPSE